MFKIFDGFIDPYKVLERLYSGTRVDKTRPLLELDTPYEYKARQELLKRGLESGACFVPCTSAIQEMLDCAEISRTKVIFKQLSS
jgi:hypothetical protein